VGSYRINEREVTGEAYENTLKQIGVLVKVIIIYVYMDSCAVWDAINHTTHDKHL
jgi:hypothetical protein